MRHVLVVVALSVAAVVLLLLIMAPLVALGGLITWALWNWVAVALGAPHISFWLAVGINLLWGLITAPLRAVKATTPPA